MPTKKYASLGHAFPGKDTDEASAPPPYIRLVAAGLAHRCGHIFSSKNGKWDVTSIQPDLTNSDFSIRIPHRNVALNYSNCCFFMLKS